MTAMTSTNPQRLGAQLKEESVTQECWSSCGAHSTDVGSWLASKLHWLLPFSGSLYTSQGDGSCVLGRAGEGHRPTPPFPSSETIYVIYFSITVTKPLIEIT